MSTEPINVYRIQVYDLLTLVQEVTKAAKAGYKIDTKNIPNYPQQVGHVFVLGMIPDDETVAEPQKEVKKEAVSEPVQEAEVTQPTEDTPVVQETAVEAVKTPGKPGRKPNGAK